jgi:hypothetical protein
MRGVTYPFETVGAKTCQCSITSHKDWNESFKLLYPEDRENMFTQMFTGHQITSCHIQEDITALNCSQYNDLLQAGWTSV